MRNGRTIVIINIDSKTLRTGSKDGGIHSLIIFKDTSGMNFTFAMNNTSKAWYFYKDGEEDPILEGSYFKGNCNMRSVTSILKSKGVILRMAKKEEETAFPNFTKSELKLILDDILILQKRKYNLSVTLKDFIEMDYFTVYCLLERLQAGFAQINDIWSEEHCSRWIQIIKPPENVTNREHTINNFEHLFEIENILHAFYTKVFKPCRDILISKIEKTLNNEEVEVTPLDIFILNHFESKTRFAFDTSGFRCEDDYIILPMRINFYDDKKDEITEMKVF